MLSKSREHTDWQTLPTGGWGGSLEVIYTQATHSANWETKVLFQLCSQALAVASQVEKGDGTGGRQTSPYPSPVFSEPCDLEHFTSESPFPICTKEMIISLRDAVRIARDDSFNTPNAKQLLSNISSSPLPSPGFTPNIPIFRNDLTLAEA